MHAQDMPSLMAEIDSLDEQLVALLSRRFERSREIGAIKKKNGQAPYDPTRVQDQKKSFVEQCVRAGLDEGMAATLIDTIVKQVIAERLSAN
ncbi:chorismate mutase [Ramlibacter sp.]|uniref:chorismate mutase n=1 Tax=Ramlibacter sp. TaxID=1917967 RepID=UPI003D0EF4D7